MRALKKLDRDKIKIKFNKNPIRMDLFLSFLTLPVRKGKGHLGCSNGWTRYYGENNLVIGGGVVSVRDEKAMYGVSRIELLDTIQYKENLSDAYSNYVNPFFISEVLNDEGKLFFLDYYRDEINKEIHRLDREITEAKANKDEFILSLNSITFDWMASVSGNGLWPKTN